MRRVHVVVHVLVLLAIACAYPSQTGGPSAEPETDPRFVGEWMIDQPNHALYEASWYRFRDDGVLEHLRDCSFGGEVPTGFVSDVAGSVRCEFADGWSAPDNITLEIDGVCSDERPREIVLAFPRDATANATGQADVE